MKRVLISLMVITLAIGLVAGATGAYFSDKDTSVNNTFTAGEMVLEVNGVDEDQGAVVTVGPLKPCEWGYEWIKLHNTGTNDGFGWLHITNLRGQNNGTNEPEGDANGGSVNDIYNWIEFDLLRFVGVDYPLGDPEAAGGIEIISPMQGLTLGDLACMWIPIGALNRCETVWLRLSFHLMAETGNEYQTDIAKFDLEFELRQQQAPPPQDSLLVLENKDENYNWVVEQDDTWGLLKYNSAGPEFDYTLYAQGLTGGTEYSLIYYADGWPGNNPGALIGTHTTDGSGVINENGSKNFVFGDLPDPADANYPGAKIWLVLSADYDGTDSMTAWNPTEYLYEWKLITYDDTDVP